MQAALRLFAYGFDWKVWDPVDQVERILVDGAYHRQVILKELHAFELIFAMRPVNDKDRNALPTNSLGSLSLQTEIGFNSSYDAQAGALGLVNSIIQNHPGVSIAINGRSVHPVTVEPIEIKISTNFFDYFIETLETYDQGQTEALQGFAKYGFRP